MSLYFLSEKGKYLALDLGGTNFRVLMVELNGKDVDIQSKTYLIPQRIMLGTGTQVCVLLDVLQNNKCQIYYNQVNTLCIASDKCLKSYYKTIGAVRLLPDSSFSWANFDLIL